KPGAEAEPITVGLRHTPVLKNRCNEFLPLADSKGIGANPILARHATAAQSERWIDVMRVVAVAKLDCTTNDAPRIIEGLLAASIRVGHAYERHIVDTQEGERTDPRSPVGVEHTPVA